MFQYKNCFVILLLHFYKINILFKKRKENYGGNILHRSSTTSGPLTNSVNFGSETILVCLDVSHRAASNGSLIKEVG